MRKFYLPLFLVLILISTVNVPAQRRGAGGGQGDDGGGPGEETTGNCLSFPVIWSDGVAKALRGAFGVPVFNGQYLTLDGTNYYLQQDSLNAWQAESVDGSAAPVPVHWVDWGDNLEAKAWYVNSVVRVETVLFEDLAVPMTGFAMTYLYGEGPDEMWGADTLTYDSTQATIYSGCTRLTIQKLTKERYDPSDPDGVPLNLAWNSALGQWEGEAETPIVNVATWLGGDGPTSYVGEINIQGKVIYGFNWNVQTTTGEPGDYRITLSFDSYCGGTTVLNTFITSDTQVVVPVEEELELVAAQSNPILLQSHKVVSEAEEEVDLEGGIVGLDSFNNLTYIDVRILPRSTKGGKGIKDNSGKKGVNNGKGGGNQK